ncbi:MAG: nitroreductase/quinone reductase family protein [Solirubrobacteraceae bacterium]
MDFLKAVDGSWPLLKRVFGAHATLYRRTRGAIGHRLPGLPPFLLLEHKGAKSGVERTTPLVYGRDGRDLVIVASKGGNPRNPAWFHNLKAHPDTVVQVGSERRPVHARVAEPGERTRLWDEMVEVYGGYRGYQQRTDREIPLMILEPR